MTAGANGHKHNPTQRNNYNNLLIPFHFTTRYTRRRVHHHH